MQHSRYEETPNGLEPALRTRSLRVDASGVARRVGNSCARNAFAPRGHLGLLLPLLGALAFLAFGQAALAESGSDRSQAMQSLDQQVQDIKSDVLAITSELRGLEEKLLYPSNTQVAVFVSIAEGKEVSLDSARLSIDGEQVTHHIYTFKELEALEKGGVQRIYTGNVPVGEHTLEIAVKGTRLGGASYESVEEFAFRKEADPKKLGVVLDSGLSGAASVSIADW